MTIRKPTIYALLAGLCLSSSACASFKLKNTPPGFIEVSSSSWEGEAELRMKAPDNVGINVTTETNFRGGTLVLWAEDMISKLSERGYVLQRQEEVKSKNGVPGTRFDFAYEPPGEEQARFYTAVLFVTDEWRVIVQVAGLASLEAEHQEDLQQLVREIKISGCKLGSKVCKSPQPRRFETAGGVAKPNGGGEAKADEAKADEGPSEPEPSEAPAADPADPAEPAADAKPAE